ncbi:hypothetical protein PQR34_12955 [Paraburkholderia sediminicola]
MYRKERADEEAIASFRKWIVAESAAMRLAAGAIESPQARNAINSAAELT